MGFMGIMIPILALMIPIFAIGLVGLNKIAQTRIEEARIRAGELGDGAIEELRAEVDQLRAELSEVHERLDFAERLLARGSEERAKG